MKVLSLCLSPTLGGLELYAYRSMQILAKQGYLKLAVVRLSTPMHELVRANEIDFKILEAKGTWPFRAGRSLAKIIDANAIDAVHINWGGDLKSAVLAKRLSKRKPVLVYSRHMRIPESKRDPYHRLIYQQVDRLIVTTQEMYCQATAHLPIDPEKVHHLYLGVGQPKPVENETCAQFLTEGGLSRDRFTIGLFGRVEHTKGQHILIEAVRHLVDSGCDVQAVIVGEAKTPAYYHSLEESIVNHAVQDKVRLYGL